MNSILNLELAVAKQFLTFIFKKAARETAGQGATP
jgi:hypothetical protein